MDTQLNKSRLLPQTTVAYFQEYTFDQINPTTHAELVIERLLGYGDLDELKWLFGYYPREQIIEWVVNLGARRLPWRRYNLWCVLLYLPAAKPFRAKEQRIWQY